MDNTNIIPGAFVHAFYSASAGWVEAIVVTVGCDYNGCFFLFQWHAYDELEHPAEVMVTLNHVFMFTFNGAVTIVA
eukprot:8408716-Ditylum_brightwellii.AAC.1